VKNLLGIPYGSEQWLSTRIRKLFNRSVSQSLANLTKNYRLDLKEIRDREQSFRSTKNGRRKMENIKHQLGHSSMVMTERYAHYSDDLLWPAVRAVDIFLGAA
jgi:integrase